MQTADDAADTKKGKVRRIMGGDDAVDAGNTNMNMGMGMSNSSCGHQPLSMMNSEKPEKKPRKKCMTEEMQMLVAGCNKVRRRVVSGICRVRPNHYWCVVAAVGYYVE